MEGREWLGVVVGGGSGRWLGVVAGGGGVWWGVSGGVW